MADVTIDKSPTIDIAGTSEREINLNPSRMYMIYHTGKDAAGAESTGDVFINSIGETVVTTYAAGSDKLVLQSGAAMPLPAKCGTIKTKTASGSVAIQILAGPDDKNDNYN